MSSNIFSGNELETLRLVLRKQGEAFKRRDEILQEHAEYLQFADALKKLQIHQSKHPEKKGLTTMMDVGCDFYTEAVVDNTDVVLVRLGKDYYLEMKIPEAQMFVSRKLVQLKKIENLLSEEVAAAKASYKLILGLKQVTVESL